MKDLFFQYYTYSDQELVELWSKCIFILDANVLLNLYRYPKSTSDDLIRIFKKVDDRIWIPFQAALEYQENRMIVIHEQVEKFSQVSAVFDNTIEYFGDELRRLQLEKKHSAIEPKEMIDKIGDLFDNFSIELSEQKEKQAKLYNNNELRDQIDELFEGKIGGPPANQEDIDKISQEGDTRFKNEIPPGYKDKDKGSEEIYVYRGLNIKRKYGDLLVWKQIIKYMNANKHEDIILITDDNKEDWWWKKKGKTYGPHKSLIEELKEETNVKKFWMYNSLGFLENAKIYLKANIKDKTIETVKEVITSKRSKLNKLELPEYYIPILSVLFETEDGKLTVQECIEKVKPLVEDKLQEDDYEELPSTGELRWHNNVKWARNDLRKLGLLSSDSPRGVWEITENGIDYLAKNK